MGSRFSRRSYKKQTYINGVRVTRKLLKALAAAEQAEAAAIALKEKQAMIRQAKRASDAAAKIEAEKVAEVKVQVKQESEVMKEEVDNANDG